MDQHNPPQRSTVGRCGDWLAKNIAWIEFVGLFGVAVGLYLNFGALTVVRVLREADLIAMASEMVRQESTETERSSDVSRDVRGGAHARIASGARYVLERAVEQNVSLIGFNASLTNLTAANLAGADFRGAKFYRTNLFGADLSQAVFSPYPSPTSYSPHRTDLRTDLTEANLTGVDLSDADLSMATLARAVLEDSILRNVEFLGADLDGTDLSGADLTGARNLTQRQLDEACGDERTHLSLGLDVGPCEKEGSRYRRLPRYKAGHAKNQSGRTATSVQGAGGVKDLLASMDPYLGSLLH